MFPSILLLEKKTAVIITENRQSINQDFKHIILKLIYGTKVLQFLAFLPPLTLTVKGWSFVFRT